jgi:glycosyltransferase involved in cell wall biosynthesis
LKGGVIEDAFCDASIAVFVPRRQLPNPLRATAAVGSLLRAYRFRYALVNSAVSFGVAKSLTRAGVPFAVLVHEFAAYLARHKKLRQLFDSAKILVFSSDLTRQDASRRIGFGATTSVHVLPQGKCHVPGDRAVDASEASRLRLALRPPGKEHSFLVLAAGTPNYRKGLDLFVSTLLKVRALAPSVPWRFVWIGGDLTGGGGDGDYTLFVSDQIERAGLTDYFTILPPTPAIETAYRAANVFLLPSRLDPLPNVAIDAMSVGLPVLCFDQTSGVADLLRMADAGQDCIASYLDVESMAKRLVALAKDERHLAALGQRLATFAGNRLGMATYLKQLTDVIEDHLPYERDTTSATHP